MKTCSDCGNKHYAKDLCRKHYISEWQKNNRDKTRKAGQKYRENNLELCRKRTRENQKALNDKNRFGGLREKVLERDGYQCVSCTKDISGKNMACVHHLNHDKKDNRMENLQSLCKSCHPAHHWKDMNEKGVLKNFTSEQIKNIWDTQGASGFNR